MYMYGNIKPPLLNHLMNLGRDEVHMTPRVLGLFSMIDGVNIGHDRAHF